ncbi:MAG: hypothetical protein HQL36_08215 [Alphaproteobacteria bacterium]|nr:hypothetical protein [Alphaproteobacteria bacterium]
MALADFQTLTDNLVRDDSGEIAVADRDQALALAVIRYSTDRPRTVVEAVVSAGGVFLDLPAGWEADFSRLTAVYLADGDDVTEINAVLDRGLSGWRIRLGMSLVAGETAHVRFTIAHLLDADTDTVPLKDREAVSGWAAALLLEQLSSLYSGNRQPTINADAVDWQSKGRDYAMRAKRLRESYLDHLGIDPKRTVPAGAVVNFDQYDSLGHDRIVHSQRRR